MNRLIAIALCGSTLATSAWGHATLEQPEAAAGSSYRAVIRIGHGCEGAPTDTLRVEIPDGVYNVKPMPKAGWTLQTQTGPYDTPFENHGRTMSEGVRGITWSGGELQDDWYDEFVFRGTIGADVAPGTELPFKVTQHCGDAVADWTDVTGGDVPNPAPVLTVTETQAGGDHHHHHADAGVTVGELRLDAPFARATPPGAPVGGGFVTVSNMGSRDDTLIGASSPIAGHVEIHEMKMEGDVMRMRELPEGLPIPAGQTVELTPGGYHLMLMDLKQPLVEGETAPVTLQFQTAGKVEMMLKVRARDAGAGDAHGHHHH